MAKLGIIQLIKKIVFLTSVTFLVGCGGSTSKQAVRPRSALDTPLTAPIGTNDPFVAKNLEELKPQPPFPPLTAPDFLPVSDDVTPAKTRLVNIQARNSALGDILHVIAETAGLNLIINDGVQQDRPVTISLKRVTADDALSTLLNAADYFYVIKGNTVLVDATGTKTFELGHPAMVQGFTIEVGGDILGSGASLSAAGSGNSSTGNIKGTISQTIKNDSKAFDFWESLEKSLQNMLGNDSGMPSKLEAGSQPNRTGTAPFVVPSQSTRTPGNIQQQIATPTPSSSTDVKGENNPRQYAVVNRLTGTIMVTATRKNLHRIESYIDTLRKALNRQVLVEARIIEVQLDDSLKFGIDWNFISTIKGLGDLTGGFGSALTGGIQASANAAAPNFRIGAVHNGSSNTISTLLTALKSQGEVKTLSNPRINVMNGQTALLSVGRNTNYIAKVTSTTTTAAGSAPTVTYTVETGNVLSGIMMGLVPYINEKGEISLTITPIVSHLVDLADATVGSDSTNQITIKVPTVDLRELSTTVKVRTGEMIIIGGLIANSQQLKDNKIPFLGDLPWLGALFTTIDHVDTRNELVVVLQPYLINND